MNQEKIGKFISEQRKLKKMTQSDLAEKLGVSDKSVGNWENGRNMPDLSLFKPLCEILDISINELISGEKIKENEYQEKLEENIINTIDYTNKKVNEKNNYIGIILIVFGILISFTAMSIFPSESSWGSVYSIFGGIISLIGVSKFTKRLSYIKRLICNYGYFIIYVILLLLIDYIGVVTIHQAPRFSYSKETIYNMIVYRAPFYNVYRINVDTSNEYYVVDTKKEYTIETVPNVPFNREQAGIDNIIKYKNKYIGNNSNTGNLIYNLPLSEYGYTIQIDSDNLGVIINYHVTDWYINANYYLEKSLIYNSVSIFSLIDNVEYIKYNFSGKTYEVTKDQIEKIYPNYKDITKDGLNKDNFNKYLESKINDDEFINYVFKKIFIDEKLTKTNKVELKDSENNLIKTITDEKEINELVDIISNCQRLSDDTLVNLNGHKWKLTMYNENEAISTILVWTDSYIGFREKEYSISAEDMVNLTNILKV